MLLTTSVWAGRRRILVGTIGNLTKIKAVIYKMASNWFLRIYKYLICYFIISLYQTIDIVPLHCPQVLLHCFSTLSSLQSYLLRNRHHGFVSLQSMPFTLSILLPVRCIDLDTSITKRKKKMIDERRWISLMLPILRPVTQIIIQMKS